MTVYPGSLDNLYYNGILPCIPYDAYQMPPVPGTQMAGPTIDVQAPMIQGAQTPPGGLAGYPFGMDGYNPKDDFMKGGLSNNTLDNNIFNRSNKEVDKKQKDFSWIKGALALGIIGATAFGVVKGAKSLSWASVKTFAGNLGSKIVNATKTCWSKVVDFGKKVWEKVVNLFKKP